ncbi:ABC transporter ATP-binding protein [Paenibacillus chibensis]|uniref:ABC transporter ATP-binding protein n=1 Tax=Paenibacillus chibensis TaxID=59846 RepID=A0ABU6PUK8_9BACL|nr:ABC transporter ATP-binding protein [Paenibacillus chibensis]
MDKVRVSVTGVSKTIKNQAVVSDISFALSEGSILACCGGNGAGKSTLLRMLAGITRPSSGEIAVNGMRWSENRIAYARQIGYMPDDYLFHHGLTAREMLSFWAALRKVPKSRVSEVLSRVGLEEQANKKVDTFSKGMRQRVLFAQALIGQPVLLLMDEPTNGLDPFWTQEFVKQLKQLREEGCSIIFSTHQLDVAEEAADQVIFMNNGINVGSGSVESFKHRYHSLYAAFHGSLGIESGIPTSSMI